ncbi:hypothetical protein BH11PSE11_BH11PSE11_30100 [soil metagenome]
MPIFFDEGELTDEQRGRYDWAVAEYARIQELNRACFEKAGEPVPPSSISPKSSLFSRLLNGKAALPFPPPLSFSFPWYEIIEVPGAHHVAIGGKLSVTGFTKWGGGEGAEAYILLNQCPWKILRMNAGAVDLLAYFKLPADCKTGSGASLRQLAQAIDRKPELIVTYGQWGEFKLSLRRIVRRCKRSAIHGNESRVNAYDGWNAVIDKVLISGEELRVKADATRASLLEKLGTVESDVSSFDRIALATESAIPRSDNPADDDLVEFSCDGWVLERLPA